ncbi:MAG: helix-turn-helix transcriptional regulator [Planctomycetaceae bacterium]|nr:helix-turn-helix transcriptional regulator [Planctomycetaceae bacterium]
MPQSDISSELIRGSLDLLVLSTLQDGSKYGYLIQQTLRDGSGERVRLTAGSLYPILHRLEAEGLVTARWDETTGRRRKWYALTASGRKQLQHRAAQWRDYVECLRNLLGPVLDALPEGSS